MLSNKTINEIHVSKLYINKKNYVVLPCLLINELLNINLDKFEREEWMLNPKLLLLFFFFTFYCQIIQPTYVMIFFNVLIPFINYESIKIIIKLWV